MQPCYELTSKFRTLCYTVVLIDVCCRQGKSGTYEF